MLAMFVSRNASFERAEVDFGYLILMCATSTTNSVVLTSSISANSSNINNLRFKKHKSNDRMVLQSNISSFLSKWLSLLLLDVQFVFVIQVQVVSQQDDFGIVYRNRYMEMDMDR